MQLWLLFDNFYIKRKLYSLFKNWVIIFKTAYREGKELVLLSETIVSRNFVVKCLLN